MLLLVLASETAAAPAETPAPKRRRPAETPGSLLLAPSAEDLSRSAAAVARPGVPGASAKALAIPTGNSSILHRQALKKLLSGNLEGALADLDFAIRISPDDSSLYTDRGFARERSDDLKGAMADWNRAIALDPTNAVAYSNRGGARLDQGDTAGANADLLKAVELAPRSASAYMHLANAENIQRDFMNAWADYRSECDHSERPPDYAQLAIYLIRARIGEGAAARELLANYFNENGRTAANEWTSRIADCLLGKLPDADLLASAESDTGATEAKGSSGHLCEAWYYIGMKKLVSRDKNGAAEAFRSCLATGQKWYVEYQFAQTELKQISPGG